MLNLTFRTLGVVGLASLVLTGCVVRESYGYRHRGYVRETVYTPVPPPPPPPPPGAPAQVVSPGPNPGEVIVTEAPPPPQVEVVTISPGPGYLWVPGAWVWHGRWVWEAGYWGRPPRRGAVWVPHHYVYRNGVHVYIAGGWR